MIKFFLNDFQVDRCLTYDFSSVRRQYNIVGLKVFYFQLSVYSQMIFLYVSVTAIVVAQFISYALFSGKQCFVSEVKIN